MNVLVAPDSFKGTFSAKQVATALAGGFARSGVECDVCPVADGGEGTLAVLAAALGATARTALVADPLGRTIAAEFGLAGETAIVEMALASGLGLLAEAERDPLHGTTYGTGQLICAAAAAGARTIIVTVGGSGTVDGGQGALQAIADVGGLRAAELVVLCDVRTPWEHAAAIYAPQKGADAGTVLRLTARLDAYAAELPRDPRGVPGTGAAGGLAGGLWSGCGASLQPGAPFVLEALRFNTRLQAADAVVCGEGRIDVQSTHGKIVGEITNRARSIGRPVHAVAGRIELTETEARTLGLASTNVASTLPEIAAAGTRIAARLLGHAIPV